MDYGGINAKVKALKGQLYGYGEYYSLCQARSIAEVGKLLSENPAYYHSFAGLSTTGDFRRTNLERRLNLSLAEDFYKIYNFIPDFRIKKYLESFTLHYEISLMKLMLCSIFDSREMPYTVEETRYLFRIAKELDIEQLLQASSVQDFVDGLYPSEFYGALKEVGKSSASLFELEMRLDLFYYMHLWKMNGSYLKGANYKIMKELTGIETDLQNILWIYRIKKYYHMENAAIYRFIIPKHYRLNKENIKTMAESKSIAELNGEINKTPYSQYFRFEGSDRLKGIEGVHLQILSRAYIKAAAMNPASIGVTVNYLHHKKLEVQNIISLVEGIRYGLKPEEIMKYLFIWDKSKYLSGQEVAP